VQVNEIHFECKKQKDAGSMKELNVIVRKLIKKKVTLGFAFSASATISGGKAEISGN
jgi:hypothetical protein